MAQPKAAGDGDTIGRPLDYPAAVAAMLAEFEWNPWFVDVHWPENEPRINAVARMVAESGAQGQGRLLDVGCGYGYYSYLFHLLGYQVTGVDGDDSPERTDLFARAGIEYRRVNLNTDEALAPFADDSVDIIVFGEVLEHILHHPAGILQEFRRMLKPGGTLVLTTPNPSNVMNAARLLRDRYVPWGMRDFLVIPKFESGEVTRRADVHYMEYPAWMIEQLLMEIGFSIRERIFIPTGSSPRHAAGKQALKRLLQLTRFSSGRLFSVFYAIAATNGRVTKS